MNCEQVEELLAACAIDALPLEEMAAVRTHLEGCRRHDAALAELRNVADRLPLAAPDREPPPALRSRLLDAFDAEVAARPAPPAPIEEARERRRWFDSLSPRFTYAAAAVLVLAVVGLAAWNVTLQLNDDGVEGEAAVYEFEGQGAGQVYYLPKDKIALLDLDLPKAPELKAYQAWRLDDGVASSMGLIEAGDGATVVKADLAGVDALAITIEPAGGSAQPTTDPILTAFP